MGRRATRGENVDRTDGAGLAVFRDDEFWCNVHSSAKARDGGDRAGPLRGSRRERRVRRLADESRHLHRVLVARLVAPLDALPRFGPRGAKRGGVIRATTDNRVERWVKFLRTVCPCRNFRKFPDTNLGFVNPQSCLFLGLFGNPKSFSGRRAVWRPHSSVGRARGEVGSRTANVRPAREKRERWSPNDRPNGRRRRRYGIPARSNPAPPRAPSRSRGALPEVTFRPCVFLPSPPSLGR